MRHEESRWGPHGTQSKPQCLLLLLVRDALSGLHGFDVLTQRLELNACAVGQVH